MAKEPLMTLASLLSYTKPMERPLSSFEQEFLSLFLKDYLNRFEAYKMVFDFSKADFSFAGRTQNKNTVTLDGVEHDLTPILRNLNVPDHISIGGDFVVGYDHACIPDTNMTHDEVALSIFDTANHGYEAFFLAGHIRAILLSVIDMHLRDHKFIDNNLFEQLNELLKGPVTQDLVQNTNPVRATRTKGAVGIHGQFHVDQAQFNFVSTGMPLFYYSASRQSFFFLEPFSGPPLGYFSNRELVGRPYVPHSLRLYPGDYLILASDGCFESKVEDTLVPFGRPQKPIRQFAYAENKDMDIMRCFNAHDPRILQGEPIEDPAIVNFCYMLEPYLRSNTEPKDVINPVIDALGKIPEFSFDDRSMIIVRNDRS
jgi:hypothetical protein